jgi:hypothetical protein
LTSCAVDHHDVPHASSYVALLPHLHVNRAQMRRVIRHHCDRLCPLGSAWVSPVLVDAHLWEAEERRRRGGGGEGRRGREEEETRRGREEEERKRRERGGGGEEDEEVRSGVIQDLCRASSVTTTITLASTDHIIVSITIALVLIILLRHNITIAAHTCVYACVHNCPR